jgi:hypothetical protein
MRPAHILPGVVKISEPRCRIETEWLSGDSCYNKLDTLRTRSTSQLFLDKDKESKSSCIHYYAV